MSTLSQFFVSGDSSALIPCEAIVVGGGGAGGSAQAVAAQAGAAGGGGGAGGFAEMGFLAVKGVTYTVTVGAGGTNGSGTNSEILLQNGIQVLPPPTTTISNTLPTISPRLLQGGVGGSQQFNSEQAGGAGYGSGGGGSGDFGTGSANGGASNLATNNNQTRFYWANTYEYYRMFCNNGGDGFGSNTVNLISSGGGGGAGGAGGNASPGTAGVAGIGRSSFITGTAVTYATGGVGRVCTTSANGVDGAANTGNGGGGAVDNGTAARTGGQGGSGVVIIAYSDSFPVPSQITGTYNEPSRPGYRVYRFTGSGTITF